MQWDAYLEASRVTHLLPSGVGKKSLTPEAKRPLKQWCEQLLGPDQSSKAYRCVREPFDHHAFQAALAAAWGGETDRVTHTATRLPTVTKEQLCFVVDAVSGLVVEHKGKPSLLPHNFAVY